MQIVKLEDIPQEGLSLTWADDRSSMLAYLQGFSRIDFDFETPLQSRVRIEKVGQSVWVKGEVKTSLLLQCVRCLKEFAHPFSSSFDLTLYPSKEAFSGEEVELEGEDMEASFLEGGEIHLSEIACEQIFLEIPPQPLCREDCKGLCPVCGKDLNLSSCDCVKQEFPSSFSALEKLKLH